MRVKFMTLVLSLVLLFGTVITVDAAGLKTVAVSVGQTTAENAAKQYLKVMPFSRQGLIEQLSSQYGSGFSEEESVAAVDKLEQEELVDWRKTYRIPETASAFSIRRHAPNADPER